MVVAPGVLSAGDDGSGEGEPGSRASTSRVKRPGRKARRSTADGLRLRDARSRHRLLLADAEPRRADPAEDPAVGRCRRRRLRRRHRVLRRLLRPPEQAARRPHRTLEDHARRLPVPREQVLPRRALRERHRSSHRPSDRQRHVLVQPARDRRRSSTASGTTPRQTGEWVYKNIDQRIVDGAVNASGAVASETGHGLQPVQSGKVNQYGALLFGAIAVGAIVLVIVNVN